MSSAGKWILGLLLLVLGAVFVARTVSSDPASNATIKKLPSAETVAKTEKVKTPPAPAADVACKKACIEVNEVANDSVTTAKLAPGSVTLSKLAFEVPNLNELENEINARKAAEAASKAAAAEAKVALGEAAAATAKNDAAITAAAQNGLVAEAAARTAAVEDITKKFTAGDADLLGRLNKEIADRGAGDDTLQLKLNAEIADRAGAINTLRGELGNANQVAAPIIKINNNEIVGDAVTSDKLLDGTIQTQDLANALVVNSKLGADAVTTDKLKDGEVKTADIADQNVTTGKIADQNVTTGKIADQNVTNQKLGGDSVTSNKIRDGEVNNSDIADGAVTFPKLDAATQNRIISLENGLAAEITNRIADVDAEELARTNADTALQNALNEEITNRSNADTALQNALNEEITNRSNADAAQVAALGAFRSQLRAADPDAGPDSRPNDGDGLVDWTNLEGVPSGFADGADDDGTTGLNTFKNELKNTGAPPDSTLNEGSDPVSWFKLKDVPLGFADGTDNADGGNAGDLTCTNASGCVSSAEISGTIDASKLAGGITGNLIQDGTITALDLAGRDSADPAQVVAGAVTSEKIFDGTIDARDLAGGAVTIAKLGTDVIDRFVAVEGRATALEGRATALEGRLTNLGSAPAPGDTDRVSTTRLSSKVTQSVTFDPAAVPATTRLEQFIPIFGLSAADLVATISPPADLNDDLLFVGSELQDRGALGGVGVAVYLYNPTGAAIDDGTKSWKVEYLDLTP